VTQPVKDSLTWDLEELNPKSLALSPLANPAELAMELQRHHASDTA